MARRERVGFTPMNLPRSALLAALLALALGPAGALQRGTSATGVAYVSGGVGDDETRALAAERHAYSLWLTTAVRRSGAYLSDVLVRIREADSGLLVLDARMDGPWLFAALPPGRYEVEAVRQDLAPGRVEIKRDTLALAAGEQRRTVLYFDTGEPEPVGDRPARP